MLSKLASLLFGFSVYGAFAQSGGEGSGSGGMGGEGSGTGGGGGGGMGGTGSSTSTDGGNDFDPNTDLECNYMEYVLFGFIYFAYPSGVCFGEYSNGTFSYYQYVCEDDGETLSYYTYNDSSCSMGGNLEMQVVGSEVGDFYSVTAHCGYTDDCAVNIDTYYTYGDTCSADNYDYSESYGMVGGYCYRFGDVSYAIACDGNDEFTYYNFTESGVCYGTYDTLTDTDEFGIDNCELQNNGYSSYGEISSDTCDETFSPITNTEGTDTGGSGTMMSTTDDGTSNTGGEGVDSPAGKYYPNLILFGVLSVFGLIR